MRYDAQKASDAQRYVDASIGYALTCSSSKNRAKTRGTPLAPVKSVVLSKEEDE